MTSKYPMPFPYDRVSRLIAICRQQQRQTRTPREQEYGYDEGYGGDFDPTPAYPRRLVVTIPDRSRARNSTMAETPAIWVLHFLELHPEEQLLVVEAKDNNTERRQS